MDRLKQIRENERKSHIEMYSNEALYQEGSWLTKPIKTVLDLFPLFDDYIELNVLDLGSGVGRNSISIAKQFQNIHCTVECVDILELAIEKLQRNAEEHGVASSIQGIVKSIEEYPIFEKKYDMILAVSALEHIDSKDSFINKLIEISKGIRENGIVCLVINSNVRENDKLTGEKLYPQFEVNLPTEDLQEILTKVFGSWEVIKSTVQEQLYDIPREGKVTALKTSVVTLVARK